MRTLLASLKWKGMFGLLLGELRWTWRASLRREVVVVSDRAVMEEMWYGLERDERGACVPTPRSMGAILEAIVEL